jgi:hypothetical protein
VRPLTFNDIHSVSGGNSQTFLYDSFHSALNYGATGALFYVLMQGGATLPVVGYGLFCGVVTGVMVAATRELFLS